MSCILDSDDQHFEVVVNTEGQYSIWPAGWEVPGGWRTVGFTGLRAACLEHIETAWTDIRPRSLVEQACVSTL